MEYSIEDDFQSISFSNKSNKYFQNNYTQQLQNRNNSLKSLHISRQNGARSQLNNDNRTELSIYDRSLLKKQETQEKLTKIKEEK